MMNLDVVRSTLVFNYSDEIPSNPDEKFPNCNTNYVGLNNEKLIDEWCRDASDCTIENGVLRFCNHDHDLWGYCEECTTVINNVETFYPDYRLCVDEEFICERGENSCIETCGGNEC